MPKPNKAAIVAELLADRAVCISCEDIRRHLSEKVGYDVSGPTASRLAREAGWHKGKSLGGNHVIFCPWPADAPELDEQLRHEPPRCFACGQIDEDGYHDQAKCPAIGGTLEAGTTFHLDLGGPLPPGFGRDRETGEILEPSTPAPNAG